MSIILLLFISLILFLIYALFKTHNKKTILKNSNLKNPFPCYPFLGNIPTILHYKKQPMALVTLQRDGFEMVGSDVMFLQLWNNVLVCVQDPEIMQKVLMSADRVPTVVERLTFVFGVSGTLNLNGEKWRFHRNTSVPVLKKMNLRNLSWVFEECCDKLMKVVDEEMGGSIELSQLMNEFTFDVIGLVAFGVDFHSLDHEQNDVLEAFKSLLNLSGEISGNHMKLLFWKYVNKPQALTDAQKTLHGCAESVIRDKFRRLENGEVNEKEDLTDMLLSKYEMNNTKGLVGEIFTFLLAGSETSSSMLTYLLYTLSRHPEIQQRARDEVFDNVGNRPITFDDIDNLKYVKCCMDETARLFTVAPSSGRQVDKDIKKDGQVIIPKGYFVSVPIHLVHNNPKIWENPEEYNPERFLNLTEKQKISFLPFGGGKRICIGKTLAEIEIVWLTATILQNYELIPASEVWPIPMRYAMTTKSTEELRVKFKKL